MEENMTRLENKAECTDCGEPFPVEDLCDISSGFLCRGCWAKIGGDMNWTTSLCGLSLDESMKDLIEGYERAGWDVEYYKDGAVSFSKDAPVVNIPTLVAAPSIEVDLTRLGISACCAVLSVASLLYDQRTLALLLLIVGATFLFRAFQGGKDEPGV